tara:strand:+ start:163 stop:885 length:723 start_codon:yes stop_codon:yes gene_type:complete
MSINQITKKTTLLTGGTRGIGSIIKQVLLERGDEVYTASRSQSSDPNHFSINLPDQIEINKTLKLNYLVFTHRYRGNDWDDDFNITVKGVDQIINVFKNLFLDEASIVILGSNAGRFVLEEQSASYHATRAALEGLMRYYAVTLGKKGIRCNCVLPASVIKPENEKFFTKDNNVRNMLEEITPLQRMGAAKEIADVVEFLCSSKSSYLTGQTLYVDGGISARGQESIAREIGSLQHPNAK